jgi:uncharacterized protein
MGCWPALGLALAIAMNPVDAARVAGLYEADVEMTEGREQAFGAALGEVLVRVTGRRDVTARAEVAPLLASAADYAQQFRQPTPDRLWVSFDGAALERELTRLNQPVWGADRPNVLLWIAVDAGGGQRFVLASGAESEEEVQIHAMVTDAAERRGVPVLFPLMDAEDRAVASFPEVWGGFEDSVLAASERYGADVVLVGRLAAGDLGYGRWTMFGADGIDRWSAGVSDSIDRVADGFAARFAVVSSGDNRTIRLAVSGLDSVEDYGRINRFLGGLTAVEALGIETVEGDQVVFRVSLRGEAATLDEAVRLGGLLQPDGTWSEQELNYRVAR